MFIYLNLWRVLTPLGAVFMMDPWWNSSVQDQAIVRSLPFICFGRWAADMAFDWFRTASTDWASTAPFA